MANDEKKVKSITYAAIDIGSNAARLLVKRLKREDGEIRFSKEILLRVPLRLGFDVFKLGRISDKREKNMMRLMKVYNLLMKIYDVSDYRACATSAMRDAQNGLDIIKSIKKNVGIDIIGYRPGDFWVLGNVSPLKVFDALRAVLMGKHRIGGDARERFGERIGNRGGEHGIGFDREETAVKIAGRLAI